MYRGALHISLSYSIKKGYLSQTANLFVNLKSNTMKNTLQRYGLLINLQIIQLKNMFYNTD